MSLSEITPGVAGGQRNAIFRTKQNKHNLFSELSEIENYSGLRPLCL